MSMQFLTKSDKETMKIGAKFAKTLRGGEVVLLVGDLGAGKTTFVKGVAAALGVKKVVNSPTFVIMKIYKTSEPLRPAYRMGRQAHGDRFAVKNLVHIDAYRGIDLGELANIGALEYFGKPDSVCFVEWGKFLGEYFEKGDREAGEGVRVVEVVFKNISENERLIEIEK